MTHRSPHPLLIIAWFALVALACNVSSSSLPPTILPKATDTPLPTIGYATLSATELPQQGTTGSAPVRPAVDTDLINLINRAEADRLFLHIDTLMRFQTRHVNSPGNLTNQGIGAAYQYVRTQFEQIQANAAGNFTVFSQDFKLNWAQVETTQYNVVGVIQGTEIGGGIILVGAHYDSTSIDPEDGLAYAPGANDNASGVAALIETARILSTRQHRSSIMFVAFAAEEVGRKGSIEFVKWLQSRQMSIDAMFSLDNIGSQTGPNGEINDRQVRLFSAGPNESSSRQLARAINLIAFNNPPNMDVLVQDATDREGRYSDHISFSDAGYPAVRFIEALEDSKRQHTPADTIDDVQASYLLRNTQTVLALLTVMADGPRPPRNITLRDNNQGTRTLVWEPVADATGYLIALRRPNSLIYDQQFEWNSNSVDWDGFTSSQFAGLVISARDAKGLMGPPSPEFLIP